MMCSFFDSEGEQTFISTNLPFCGYIKDVNYYTQVCETIETYRKNSENSKKHYMSIYIRQSSMQFIFNLYDTNYEVSTTITILILQIGN